MRKVTVVLAQGLSGNSPCSIPCFVPLPAMTSAKFWAWIPTIERFAQWFGLGEEAAELYAQCRDVDLRMLRALVRPWPNGWPDHVLDLNAAAVEAGVEVPPRAVNHLHPRVHAEWNRELFARIHASRDG